MNASTGEQVTDEELASRARGGSHASFEELVRRYQVPLLRFLQRRGPRPHEAEDVLQETFLRAYRSLDRYKDGYRFKTWLFTIAYRLAISAGRSARPTVSLTDTAFAVDHDQPDAPALRRESSERLWDVARRSLSDEQYAAVWLHYVEDANPRDIAEVMDRSWVWVRTALHRSRRKLAVVLTSIEQAAHVSQSVPEAKPTGAARGPHRGAVGFLRSRTPSVCAISEGEL